MKITKTNKIYLIILNSLIIYPSFFCLFPLLLDIKLFFDIELAIEDA
jgi:hypothetical protein